MSLTDQNTYDYIIIGAGLAGLSLALHMARTPLRHKKILLIDKDAKDRDDRTWAFWSEPPGPYEDIVYRTWDNLHWRAGQRDGRLDLGGYRYQVIRGLDFYRRALDELSALPSLTFLRHTVRSVSDGGGWAHVSVDGCTYRSRWAFDSRLRRADGQAHPGDQNSQFQHLKLHFEGWEIETPVCAFSTDAPTFFDFRTPKDGETRFFYLLPYSERRALVEFTLFSNKALERSQYTQALQDYLHKVLGLTDYQILRRESGCLPVSDRPYPRRLGRRVLAIGAKGGRLKASSGYAFTRIQADSAAIVASLRQNSHPFDLPQDSPRYRLFDSLLLEIMADHGEAIEIIFSAMFARNPGRRILRFLDERGSIWENLLLIATLPPTFFIQTLLRRAASRLPGLQIADKVEPQRARSTQRTPR